MPNMACYIHVAKYSVLCFNLTATSLKLSLPCRKISSCVVLASRLKISPSLKHGGLPVSLTSIRNDVCKKQKMLLDASTRAFASDVTLQNIDLSFGDLEALVKSGDIQLIDVREPKEITEYGSYPRAINIPLGELSDALRMPDESFVEHYKCPKPQPHHKNIVFCAQGPIRSKAAVELAKKHSFNKTRHYRGGWEEYHVKMGLPLKQKA